MENKLEVTLRITMNRDGLQRVLNRKVENDHAFFVLGLVQSQLIGQYGAENCEVEMASATGISPTLAVEMSRFARRYKLTLDRLTSKGEAYTEERDVVEMLIQMHQVVVVPWQNGWRVMKRTRTAEGQPSLH